MNKLLSCALVALCLFAPSCASTGTGQKLEAMSQEDFQSMSLRVELVTRALVGRLVRDGQVDRDRVLKVADAVDAILKSPVLAGTSLVSGKLREQGWTDDEVMLAVLLVEDLIRKYGGLGDVGLPLGQHGRELLTVISVALRQAAGGGTSSAELDKAEKIIDDAGATVKP